MKSFPTYQTPTSLALHSAPTTDLHLTTVGGGLGENGLEEKCVLNFEFCMRVITKLYYYQEVSHSHVVHMDTIKRAFERLGVYDVHLLFAYSAATAMSMKAAVYGLTMYNNSNLKQWTTSPSTGPPLLSIMGIMGKLGGSKSSRGIIAFRGTNTDSDWSANLDFQRINIFPQKNTSVKVRENSDSLLDSQPLLGPIKSRLKTKAVYVHEGFYNLYTRNIGIMVDKKTPVSRCFCATPCQSRLRHRPRDCEFIPPKNVSKIDVSCILDKTEIQSGKMLCGKKKMTKKVAGSLQQQILNLKHSSFSRVTEWVVTGHSLGGALATLTATHLELLHPGSVVGLYTIASPMVGERTFHNLFHEVLHLGDRTFRLYHMDDVVPTLPFLSIPVGRPFPIYGTPNDKKDPHSIEHSYLPLIRNFLGKPVKTIHRQFKKEHQKREYILKTFGKPALTMAAALYGIPPALTDAHLTTALTAAGTAVKTFILPEDPPSSPIVS